MSPQFCSALAALVCLLPACEEIQLPITLPPPLALLHCWLLFSASYSHHSFLTPLVIFSFSLPRVEKVRPQLFPITRHPQSSLLLVLYPDLGWFIFPHSKLWSVFKPLPVTRGNIGVEEVCSVPSSATIIRVSRDRIGSRTEMKLLAFHIILPASWHRHEHHRNARAPSEPAGVIPYRHAAGWMRRPLQSVHGRSEAHSSDPTSTSLTFLLHKCV